MTPRPPIAYPDRPFHHLLEDAADRSPESVALRDGDRELTFRELDGCVNALARSLLDRGIGPRTRIALRMQNSAEWVIALFAASKVGAAAVLLNPRWTRTDLESAIAVAAPTVLVCDAVHDEDLDAPYSLVISLEESAPLPAQTFWSLILGQSGDRPPAGVEDWAELPVVLPFSSGTTGLPKAAVHTHRTLVAATLQWQAAGRMQVMDRMLLFLPLFHVYGVITVAGSLAAGASLRLMARFDAREVLARIEDERITMSFGAAPVALAFSELDPAEGYDMSSLRYFVWGATPMDQRLAAEVTERFGIPWLHAYGATEAPLLHCNPVERPARWRLDSPGLPVSDVRVKVVDLITRSELPTGELGEVLVTGPQVFAGYLPEGTDSPFEGGWLRTGDIGQVDDEGWIRLVDRAKEMIKVNAFQVAPAELERLLLAHPHVADAGVFGVSDARTGEAPVAAVVPAAGTELDPQDVVGWIAERAATYKRIREVVVVAEIPKTASGKVLRRELRAHYETGPTRESSALHQERRQ